MIYSHRVIKLGCFDKYLLEFNRKLYNRNTKRLFSTSEFGEKYS